MFAFSRQEIVLMGVFLAIGIFLFIFPIGTDQGQDHFEPENFSTSESISQREKIPKMVVHVSGAVVSPGVYSFSEGKRIIDAIETAGGASWNAALDQINLAAPLRDGMQIFVPFERNEVDEENGDGENNLINVNRATQGELEALPNIGPSRARAIIEFRKEHGSFQKPEDLLEISGIGEKTLEQLREHVRFY